MSDVSPLTSCFPNADAIFSGRFKAISEIKNHCLVAIDANVLLAPYALSEQPINQIADTYGRLAKDGRLVIPAQVAREFAKNRNTKIGELLKTVQDQMSRQASPMGTKYAFLRNLPEYEASLAIAEQIEAKQKELLSSLRKVADAVRGWNVTDPVWDAYRRVFPGNVLELNADTLAGIPKELKFRTDHSIPPGYKDAQKSDGGAGDLIIWKTLLQVGAERKKDLVFVTLDQKPDWWTQANGGALFPRYELIEEYRAATGGHTIHLLRFSEFLSQFGAAETVIEEVQRVEDEAEIIASEEEDEHEQLARTYAPLDEYLVLRKAYNDLGQRIIGKSYSRSRHRSRGNDAKVALITEEMKRLRRDRKDLANQLTTLVRKHPSLQRYEEKVLAAPNMDDDENDSQPF